LVGEGLQRKLAREGGGLLVRDDEKEKLVGDLGHSAGGSTRWATDRAMGDGEENVGPQLAIGIKVRRLRNKQKSNL
jgi:hypothetical protein